MKNLHLIGCLIVLGISSQSFAGKIRTIHANTKKMSSVHLRMGQSTVLRFLQKPKKVIIGNQNYYSVEFIENDVAIQPLDTVGTNLFVYTPSHVYGFLLKVSNSGQYDDLVNVKWRNKSVSLKKKSSPPKKKKRLPKKINQLITIKDIKVKIEEMLFFEDRDIYALDFIVSNLRDSLFSTKEILLEISRNKKKLNLTKVIFEKNQIPPSQDIRGRAFVTLKQKRGFSFYVHIDDKKERIIIPKRAL